MRTATRPPSSNRSFFASQAQRGAWSSLSATEQAAWNVLQYTEDSWEGRRSPPQWKEWSALTLEEHSAVKYGLGIKNSKEWEALAPPSSSTSTSDTGKSTPRNHNEIPSLSSLLDGSYDDDSDDDQRDQQIKNDKSNALAIAQETRSLRQRQQSASAGSSLASMAFGAAKGLAPIIGPMMRSAARHTRGGKGIGLELAGTLLEQVPSAMDASSGVLDITGIDTVIYLDDSGSMIGSNLVEGQSALESLEQRLKTDPNDEGDQRFLPTRVLKFGNNPLVLTPSDENWSTSLISAAWDGSSGGTYMWKMIHDDIKLKYRPAGGKLRVVVITDGADTLSPGKYHGPRGFDPLMSNLLQDGFDIEWHIIVVGNYGLFPELSDKDKNMYKSLCRATGGQFISLDATGWNESDPEIYEFLGAIEDSGYADSEKDRKNRQEQYRLEARRGNAVHFDWLPALSDRKAGKKQ